MKDNHRKKEQYKIFHNELLIKFFYTDLTNDNDIWLSRVLSLTEAIVELDSVPKDLQLDTLIDYAKEHPEAKLLHNYLRHLPGMPERFLCVDLEPYEQHRWIISTLGYNLPHEQRLIKNIEVKRASEDLLIIECKNEMLEVMKDSKDSYVSINKNQKIKLHNYNDLITLINNFDLLEKKDYKNVSGLLNILNLFK